MPAFRNFIALPGPPVPQGLAHIVDGFQVLMVVGDIDGTDRILRADREV